MHSTTLPLLPAKPSFDWMALLDTVFLVHLREELDAKAEHGREDTTFLRGL